MTSDQRQQDDDFGARLPGEDAESVEDFIKELEAKEKDLDISSEMVIEVEDPDFDDMNIPDFILNELNSVRSEMPTVSAAKPAAARTDPKVESLQNEIGELRRRLAEMVSERADLQERSLKRLNEFENFKRRLERERADTFNRQLENLAMKMLPVLDNLDRALNFSASISEEKRREFQHFFDGIVLVYHQINDVFGGMGVHPVVAVGEPFDPHLHEAVVTVETDAVAPNTVTEELLRGYQVGGRVIRHSMVKVAKAPRSETVTPETGSEEPPTENGEEEEN